MTRILLERNIYFLKYKWRIVHYAFGCFTNMLSSELGCNMRYIKFLSRLIFKPIYIRYEKIIDKLNELDDAIEKTRKKF